MNTEDCGRRVSRQEFLAIEASSAERAEYIGGSIFTRKIESKNHGRILGNLQSALLREARNRHSDLYAGTAKLITPRGDHIIAYMVATCDPRDVDDADPLAESVVRHPWLVIEITSPQTSDRDLVSKAAAYQRFPRITHFVTVASHRRMLYVGVRNYHGSFRRLVGDLGDRIVLPGIAENGIDIIAIYRDTTVPLE